MSGDLVSVSLYTCLCLSIFFSLSLTLSVCLLLGLSLLLWLSTQASLKKKKKRAALHHWTYFPLYDRGGNPIKENTETSTFILEAYLHVISLSKLSTGMCFQIVFAWYQI